MTITEQLRSELDRLAADLANVDHHPDPEHRRDLLLAAVLLTGWGDLAQDALHIATCRVHLADPQRPPDRAAILTELTRLVRELTDDPD